MNPTPKELRQENGRWPQAKRFRLTMTDLLGGLAASRGMDRDQAIVIRESDSRHLIDVIVSSPHSALAEIWGQNAKLTDIVRAATMSAPLKRVDAEGFNVEETVVVAHLIAGGKAELLVLHIELTDRGPR